MAVVWAAGELLLHRASIDRRLSCGNSHHDAVTTRQLVFRQNKGLRAACVAPLSLATACQGAVCPKGMELPSGACTSVLSFPSYREIPPLPLRTGYQVISRTPQGGLLRWRRLPDDLVSEATRREDMAFVTAIHPCPPRPEVLVSAPRVEEFDSFA